ncbi:TonB-dependent receptor [uncultured Cyclobacterium sp.]|uniref:TonB-dependent receptor n=1 Tax=uncultured Cyclobacterium sp. TaxID=453820 RepID=UPI0030EDF5BE
MRFIYLPIFILVTIGNSFLLAQSTTGFSISGTISDESGEPMMATVLIHELGTGTAADQNGKFTLRNLNPGNYHLHVSHLGYKSLTKTVSIQNNDVRLDWQMEPSAITLQSLTIEANPFKNGPVEQSQTIDVIDRDFIERNNSGTFSNALEKLPGISTINTGVGISKPVIRGMSSNRIQVNDRGIKQEGQQWGADHGLEIDPFDVDRVEIVKGPASLIYGSDGMSGVINISPAPIPHDGEIKGHLINSYQTNNNMRSHSAMVEGNENGFIYKGRLTFQDYQDYRVPADEFTYAGYVLPVYENRLKNTAGKERHFSLMTGIRKKWGKSTITLSRFGQQAGIFTGAVGIPNSYNLQHNGDYGNIELPNQDNSHVKVISNTTIQLNQNWLEIDLGYQRNERQEQSLPHAHGISSSQEGNLALGLYLNTYTANLRFNHHISNKEQAIIGFQSSLMDNQFDGFEFLLPQFKSQSAGFFYFHEYRLKDNFILNAGLRVDVAKHQIDAHSQPTYNNGEATGNEVLRNPDIDRSYANLSGATGFSWIVNNKSNLKLNLGSSYRVPSPIELATNGIHHGNFRHELGNPNLNSERSFQSDLNFTYSQRNLLIGFSPYLAYYSGYIYLSPTAKFSTLPGAGTLWEYRQNNAIFSGGEVKIQWAILPNLQTSIAGEFVNSQNLDTSLPLPLTPPASVLFGLDWELPYKNQWLPASNMFIEYRQVAAQNRVDRNERVTEGYVLLEAGLGLEFAMARQIFKFRISGKNLLNSYYFNHMSRYRLLNLPEQGRNINVSLKIPIQIKNQ